MKKQYRVLMGICIFLTFSTLYQCTQIKPSKEPMTFYRAISGKDTVEVINGTKNSFKTGDTIRVNLDDSEITDNNMKKYVIDSIYVSTDY